jgi:hypothetical protein
MKPFSTELSGNEDETSNPGPVLNDETFHLYRCLLALYKQLPTLCTGVSQVVVYVPLEVTISLKFTILS